MTLFQVFVWVPTKGWKFIRQFGSLNAAVDCAEEFEPLEVNVRCPDGRQYFGGKVCMVDHSLIPTARTLPVK